MMDEDEIATAQQDQSDVYDYDPYYIDPYYDDYDVEPIECAECGRLFWGWYDYNVHRCD
jgi:hypothetical protein